MSDLSQTMRDLPKRCAVAKLVGHCEGLISSGLLGEKLEARLRETVAETLAAFNMPSKAEMDDAQARSS